MNGAIFVNKPEWKVLLDLLKLTDTFLLERLARKMMILLFRHNIPEITSLLNTVNPRPEDDTIDSQFANNPIPKTDWNVIKRIQNGIFKVAEEHLSEEQINTNIQKWLRQEKARFLSIAVERKDISFANIVDKLNQFCRMSELDVEDAISVEERLSIRAALVRRFLSEQLEYVNIAKKYISIVDFSNLLEHVIGTANASGRLGGKSAGVILAGKIIDTAKIKHPALSNVKVPKSWFISSDCILEFIHYNMLEETTHMKYCDPMQIRQEYPFLEQIFKHSFLPAELFNGINLILDNFDEVPIIVRSSSILEDQIGSAFSGKYKSLFLANQGDRIERLSALCDAILEVYASTFGPDPINYRKERGLIDFQEEMGILIQEVVGHKVGKYFFPICAGVSFSNNEFRWSPRIKREDGIIRLVMGLGTRAVDRIGEDYPLLLCPGQPNLRTNFDPENIVKYCQKNIDVMNLETNNFESIPIDELIKNYGDQIPLIDSLLSSYEDEELRPLSMLSNNYESGNFVLTFDTFLKYNPFIKQIKIINDVLKEAFGHPVDIEFAMDTDHLYILQCRPQCQATQNIVVPIPENIPNSNKLFSATKYITDGYVPDIEYIVYVDPIEYDQIESMEKMLDIGNIVNELNSKLPPKKFILMGPGRWGSRGDIKLGVRVSYSDINKTAMLIEIAKQKKDYLPDLSFGTHFFQDLVESNIRYLPLYPDDDGNIFNEKWFKSSNNLLSEVLPNYTEYQHIVHVINVPKVENGKIVDIVMNGDKEYAIGYLK